MRRIIVCFLIVLVFAFARKATNNTFTGFFSRQFPIDTTRANCGDTVYAVIYAFESDSTRGAAGKLVLYGLMKCPETIDKNLLTRQRKLTVHFRESTREDIKDVIVTNRHRYFNVRYYLITGIEEAD